MKILFIGTVNFSKTMLRTLIDINAEIVGVVTGENSGMNADYADLLPTCTENNISCRITDDINSSEDIAWVRNKNPDIVFCFGWSHLLSEEFISISKIGMVGFHPTALPKNRGRHPLIWALVLGLKETASTFFFIDSAADSGDILAQNKILIDEQDNAKSLYQKIEKAAKFQLIELVASLESGRYSRMKQDDQQASYWRKRSVKDGVIDWRMSARSIHNLVRGLSHPYVGAEFSFNDHVFKVWESQVIDVSDIENIEPGKVLDINSQGQAVIRCGEQCIILLQIEPMFKLTKGQYL